jgi:hypothetical protein
VHQQHDVAGVFENTAQSEEDIGRDVGLVLAPLHDVDVVLGDNLEQVQHLVKHLPVLGDDTNV